MDARTAMERLRTMLPGWTSPTIPISTDAAKKLLDAFDEMAKLREAVALYLSEHDNPAPDYVYRHHLREKMRAALAKVLP